MRVSGFAIVLMASGDLSMSMEMFTKASGSMTKLMVTVSTRLSMVLCTQAIGSMMSSMVSGSRHGAIKADTRDNTRTEKSMVKDVSTGKMDRFTVVSSFKTICQGKAATVGQTSVPTTGAGRTIRWMGMESTAGPTAASSKVTLPRITKREMARCTTLTVPYSWALGKLTNRTVTASRSLPAGKSNKAAGTTANLLHLKTIWLVRVPSVRSTAKLTTRCTTTA